MGKYGDSFTSEAEACIAQAFLSVYETKPACQISVQEIVSRSGYSRGTFYRKFDGVDDLLERVEAANTCTKVCAYIIENADTIPLEDATDAMADFYEQRADAVRVLLRASNGNNYLNRQVGPMQAMFAALLQRAYVMTPLQLDVASHYIASAKAGMVRLWVERDQVISLNQINKMSENLIESSLWTFVAMQAPAYGGPHPKRRLSPDPFDYPWMREEGPSGENEG